MILSLGKDKAKLEKKCEDRKNSLKKLYLIVVEKDKQLRKACNAIEHAGTLIQNFSENSESFKGATFRKTQKLELKLVKIQEAFNFLKGLLLNNPTSERDPQIDQQYNTTIEQDQLVQNLEEISTQNRSPTRGGAVSPIPYQFKEVIANRNKIIDQLASLGSLMRLESAPTSLSQMLSLLQRQIEQERDRFEKLEDEKLRLQNENDKLEGELHRSSSEASSVMKEMNKLTRIKNTELEEYEQRVLDLTKLVEERTLKFNEIEAIWENEKKVFNARLKEFESKAKTMTSEEIVRLEEEKAALKREVENLRQKMMQLQNEHIEARKSYRRDLIDIKERLETEYKDVNKRLESEVKDLRRKSSVLEELNTDLQETVTMMQADFEGEQESKLRIEEQFTILKNSGDKTHNEIENYQSNIDELNQEVISLKRKESALTEELVQEKKVSVQRLKELELLKNKNAITQKEDHSQTQEFKKFAEELQQQLDDHLVESDKQISQLEQELQEAQEEIESKFKQITKLSAENKELLKKLSESDEKEMQSAQEINTQIEDLTNKLKKSEERVQSLQNDIISLEEKYNNEVDLLKLTQDKKQTRIQEASTALESATSKNNDLITEFSNLKEENECLMNEIKSDKKKNNILKENIGTLKSEIKNLRENLKSQNDSRLELATQLSKSKANQENLKIQYDQEKKNHEKLKEANQSMVDKLGENDGDFSVLNNQLKEAQQEVLDVKIESKGNEQKLEEQIVELKQEIEKLQEEIMKHEFNVDDLSHQITLKEEQIDEESENNAKLQKSEKALKNEKKMLEGTILDLESRIKDKDHEIEQKENEIKDADMMHKMSEKKCEELEKTSKLFVQSMEDKIMLNNLLEAKNGHIRKFLKKDLKLSTRVSELSESNFKLENHIKDNSEIFKQSQIGLQEEIDQQTQKIEKL